MSCVLMSCNYTLMLFVAASLTSASVWLCCSVFKCHVLLAFSSTALFLQSAYLSNHAYKLKSTTHMHDVYLQAPPHGA